MSSSDSEGVNSDAEFIDLSALWRGPYLLHDDEDEEPVRRSSGDNQNDSGPGIVLELTPLALAGTPDEAPAETSNEIPPETSTEASAEISTEASIEASTDNSADTSNETSTATSDESSDEFSADASAESPASNLAQELSPYDIIMNELNNFRTGMMTGRVTDISRQSNLDYIQRLDNARQRILDIDESADSGEPNASSSSHRRDVSRARRRLLLEQEDGFYTTDPAIINERIFYRFNRLRNRNTPRPRSRWTNPSMPRTEPPSDNMSNSELRYSQFIAGLMNTEGSSIGNNETVEPRLHPASQSGQNRGTVSRISTVNETSSAGGPSTSSAPTVSTTPNVNKPTFHATMYMSDDGESETDSSTSNGPEAAPEAGPATGHEASSQIQQRPNSELLAAIEEITANFEQMALDIARRYSAEQQTEQQDNSSNESEENQSSNSDESAPQ